jgi:hypothetical protein
VHSSPPLAGFARLVPADSLADIELLHLKPELTSSVSLEKMMSLE